MFLLHDRAIHMRTDDSVVRAVRGRPAVLRRSRGYVPDGLVLPVAAGSRCSPAAPSSRTPSASPGPAAWVGHHVGDLKNYETLTSFTAGVEHFERLFAVAPEVVAHDLHPSYPSTSYALEREGVSLDRRPAPSRAPGRRPRRARRDGPAVGAIFDGAARHRRHGLGRRAARRRPADFERVGHLFPVRLPGGDAAVREPWRMACAWLSRGGGRALPRPAGHRPRRWRRARLVASGVASPLTTSAGRLFDAVSALCGVRPRSPTRARPPIELEAVAARRRARRYPLAGRPGGAAVLDPRAGDPGDRARRRRGMPARTVSARFHAGSPRTASACAEAAGARVSTPSSCRAACSTTGGCSSERRRCSRRAGCGCCCRSSCRRGRRDLVRAGSRGGRARGSSAERGNGHVRA